MYSRSLDLKTSNDFCFGNGPTSKYSVTKGTILRLVLVLSTMVIISMLSEVNMLYYICTT